MPLTNNSTLQKIAQKISPHQIKVEGILFVLVLLGLLFKEQGGWILLTISLSSFSILYFLLAFLPQKGKHAIETFIYKVHHISWAIGILGILYEIQHYPNAEIMMRIALYSMLMGLIGLIILKIRQKKTAPLMDANGIRILVFFLALMLVLIIGQNEPGNNFNNNQEIETETRLDE